MDDAPKPEPNVAAPLEIPEQNEPARRLVLDAPEETPAPVSDKDITDFIAHARRVAQNAALRGADTAARRRNSRWLAWSGAVVLIAAVLRRRLAGHGAVGRSRRRQRRCR